MIFRVIGRVCYGIAGALGLIGFGMLWRENRNYKPGPFAKPPSQTGLFFGFWAPIVALTGKLIQDLERERVMQSIASGVFVPKGTMQTPSLRSTFDRGDLVDMTSDQRTAVPSR